jgi:hypothetical protein
MDNQKGISKDVRSILRMIAEEDKMNIEYFYLQSLSRDYHVIGEPEEIPEYVHNSEFSYDDNNFLLNLFILIPLFRTSNIILNKYKVNH